MTTDANIGSLAQAIGLWGKGIETELDMRYSRKFDSSNAPVYYKGYAAIGALEGSAVWRMQRITLSTDGVPTISWADGNDNFDNIWTNRTSLTYI